VTCLSIASSSARPCHAGGAVLAPRILTPSGFFETEQITRDTEVPTAFKQETLMNSLLILTVLSAPPTLEELTPEITQAIDTAWRMESRELRQRSEFCELVADELTTGNVHINIRAIRDPSPFTTPVKGWTVRLSHQAGKMSWTVPPKRKPSERDLKRHLARSARVLRKESETVRDSRPPLWRISHLHPDRPGSWGRLAWEITILHKSDRGILFAHTSLKETESGLLMTGKIPFGLRRATRYDKIPIDVLAIHRGVDAETGNRTFEILDVADLTQKARLRFPPNGDVNNP